MANLFVNYEGKLERMADELMALHNALSVVRSNSPSGSLERTRARKLGSACETACRALEKGLRI